MRLEPINIVCPACGNPNYMRRIIGKNVEYFNTKCLNCLSYFNFEEISGLNKFPQLFPDDRGKMKADYISRDDILNEIHRFRGYIDEDIEYRMKLAINKIPSADVEEMVRCKDCRHRDPEDHKCDCGQLERAGCMFPVDDDYFCAYGER